MGFEKKVGLLMVVVFCYALSHSGLWVEAQVHHVVGDDRGWDIASDIASWMTGRTFAVGDFIWFAYSGGVDKDKVVELKSKEEFESCDVSNPIKMYTDGLDKILLEEEGMRYFTSSNPESCKKGLRLPVDVKSKSTAQINQSNVLPSSEEAALWAQEPTSPSSSTKNSGPVFMLIGALLLSYVGL